jgi:hypothetical protein
MLVTQYCTRGIGISIFSNEMGKNTLKHIVSQITTAAIAITPRMGARKGGLLALLTKFPD